jgi:autotransporter-associated beta strand protein
MRNKDFITENGNNRFILFLLLFCIISTPLFGQRKMENLGRGTLAVQTDNGIYVNWRIKGTEWFDVAYNLYRNGTKINSNPIAGASNYTDASGSPASGYKVKAVINGVEQNENQEVPVLEKPFVEFKLREIPKIAGMPDSIYNVYRTNDMTAADLDGDGEYELIVKRLNSFYNAADPFLSKYHHLIEAYKTDGTCLWTINLGPNVFHHHEINILAYDFDGDGKAEIVMRSSEGTIDGEGNKIGDVANAMGELIPDGKTDYRDIMKSNGGHTFEYEGIEFLSLYDGETGKELDRIIHIPRQPAAQWGYGTGMKGGQLAHRATKFHYGAPYLDGKKPSVFISRGIYEKIMMRTYDIVNKKFVFKWEFNSDNNPGYSGQGNHNYVVADVDNDGCDEIVYGSMTVDNDGKGLYTTRLGHGDAIHVSDFDPYRKGLEVWACLESSPNYGSSFRAAESGASLWHRIAGRDMGRAMAANISNKYKGTELWDNDHMYSASERKEISLARGATAFRIYWTGDLRDELASRGVQGVDPDEGKWEGIISTFDDNTASWQNVLTATGYFTCLDSKGVPCLQADLFGDWREEIVYRSLDDQSIRIYTTTYPTEHRIYTLMHDMQYRQAVAWQMCGYNQPPHVSYFVGEAENILLPPPPVMDNERLVMQPGATVWNTSASVWKKDGATVNYSDGEDVLFDFLSMNGNAIALSSTVRPGNVFINSSGVHTLNAANGKLSGNMRLIKQGSGTFFLNGIHDYTGTTEIWNGLIDMDGKLENSPVYMHLFGELSINGEIGENTEMRFGSRLYPGRKGIIDTTTFNKKLQLTEQANFIFDFGQNGTTNIHDKIIVKGDFEFTKGFKIFTVKTDGDIIPGEYPLIEVAGTITGNAANIQLDQEASDFPLTIKIEGNKVILCVPDIRNAKKPKINTQPQALVVNLNGNEDLSVEAIAPDGGVLSYQWYSNTSNSTSNGTAINGAISTIYTPVTYSAKTTYYYVVVTNTNNGVNGVKTASDTSTVVPVTVLKEGVLEGVIKNPSFEEGSYAGYIVAEDGSSTAYPTPNGWNMDIVSLTGSDIQIKNTGAAHGTYRYYIWCDDSADNLFNLYQVIVLSKGEYKLSASLKPQVPSSTYIYADTGNEIKESPATGSWNTWGIAEVSFMVPENTTSVRIGVSATARIMYDNFQLTKLSNGTGFQLPDINIPDAILYPNPTDGLFTLNFPTEGTYNIAIYNMVGTVLLRQTIRGQTKQVDIRSYPSGIYFLTIECNGQKSTKKIIKKC